MVCKQICTNCAKWFPCMYTQCTWWSSVLQIKRRILKTLKMPRHHSLGETYLPFQINAFTFFNGSTTQLNVQGIYSPLLLNWKSREKWFWGQKIIARLFYNTITLFFIPKNVHRYSWIFFGTCCWLNKYFMLWTVNIPDFFCVIVHNYA